MEWLIYIGAALAAIGLVGLIASAVTVMKAKRQGLEDADLRAQVQKSMVLNMASLAVSVIGLMCVIIGVSLA